MGGIKQNGGGSFFCGEGATPACFSDESANNGLVSARVKKNAEKGNGGAEAGTLVKQFEDGMWLAGMEAGDGFLFVYWTRKR